MLLNGHWCHNEVHMFDVQQVASGFVVTIFLNGKCRRECIQRVRTTGPSIVA